MRKTRFTTKAILATFIPTAVILGVWFAPRNYVARVFVVYGGRSVTATPHPRFIKYRDEGLSNLELQEKEKAWILSHEVVSEAVQLLAAEGVSENVFGDDPVEWFRERVVITPLDDCTELTLSNRESSYTGSKNNRRDTLAWKALVALMRAYQRNSFTSATNRPNYDILRLPTCNFHYVESRLW